MLKLTFLFKKDGASSHHVGCGFLCAIIDGVKKQHKQTFYFYSSPVEGCGLSKAQRERILPVGSSGPEMCCPQYLQSCYCGASAAPISQVLRGHFLSRQLCCCI